MWPPTRQPRHYPDHHRSFQSINGQYYSKGERGDYYNVANKRGIPSYAITPQNADSFPANRVVCNGGDYWKMSVATALSEPMFCGRLSPKGMESVCCNSPLHHLFYFELKEV